MQRGGLREGPSDNLTEWRAKENRITYTDFGETTTVTQTQQFRVLIKYCYF